jgi:hypothetical protein
MKKTAQTDFSAAQLPHTRWELLRDVLLHQTGSLISTSLLLSLFALPLLCDYLVFSTFAGTAYANGSSMSSIFALCFYGALVAIPCIGILFVGYAGAYEVGQRLSFLDGVLSSVSFFYGLKKNWRSALGIGFLVGLSFAFALVGSLYLLFFYQASPILMGIGIGLLLFQFLLVGSLSRYFLAQEGLYQNSFGATLKNAFLFTLMKMPCSFGLFLLSPGIIIFLFAFSNISAYVGMGLFLFFSSFGVLIWSIYAHKVFDSYINAEHYPGLVNKGLYPKEDEPCPKSH